MVCFFATTATTTRDYYCCTVPGAAASPRGRPRDSAVEVVTVVAAKKQTIKVDHYECLDKIFDSIFSHFLRLPSLLEG